MWLFSFPRLFFDEIETKSNAKRDVIFSRGFPRFRDTGERISRVYRALAIIGRCASAGEWLTINSKSQRAPNISWKASPRRVSQENAAQRIGRQISGIITNRGCNALVQTRYENGNHGCSIRDPFQRWLPFQGTESASRWNVDRTRKLRNRGLIKAPAYETQPKRIDGCTNRCSFVPRGNVHTTCNSLRNDLRFAAYPPSERNRYPHLNET